MNKTFFVHSKNQISNALSNHFTDQNQLKYDMETFERLFLEKVNGHDMVMISAGLSGGIQFNIEHPVDLMSDNLLVQQKVIMKSHEADINNLLFIGRSCCYPAQAEQPMKEAYLFTGALEKTSLHFSVAKLAGIYLCDAYRNQFGRNYFTVIPTNIYGPYDSFDPQQSHVLSAMITKFHMAKMNGDSEVAIWGDGSPLREFLYIDDFIDGCMYLLSENKTESIINLGSGYEISIRDLAYTIRDVVGYQGKLQFDHSKPNGTHRKLLDSSKAFELGWRPKIAFEEGIYKTYQWYLTHIVQGGN